MTTRPCLHPHVGADRRCTLCGATFGLCDRHGIYLLGAHAACPKCRAAAYGKVEGRR